MALNVLKDCKKYVILEIYNPASYLITESENGNYYEKEVRWFKHSLINSMENHADAKQFSIGKLVAVKNEKGFQIGRINDIFNRYGETKYLISLIDSGKIVESDKKSFYLTKNQILKDEMKNAFKISLHGVQPVVLDINDKNPASCGIFHLRKCHKWTPDALEFVKSIFINNPNIFVKIITYDKSISGEIYFIEDFDWKPVSLSQKLCDKGFAMFCDTTENSSNNYSQIVLDDHSKEIKEKIPANAFSSDFELYKTFSELHIPNKSVTERRNFRIESDETMSSQQLSCHMKNDSSNTSTESIKLNCSNLGFASNTLFEYKANKYSSSGSGENPLMSPSNSITAPNNNFKSESVGNNNQDICRIVLRNLKFFCQEKSITGKCSQN